VKNLGSPVPNLGLWFRFYPPYADKNASPKSALFCPHIISHLNQKVHCTFFFGRGQAKRNNRTKRNENIALGLLSILFSIDEKSIQKNLG